jgi:cytochrome c oxidase subunit 4
MAREIRLLAIVWLALMLLLATTVIVTFLPWGAIKPVINLVVAAAKAGLILWVFMHLREQPGLNRVVAVAAAAWLMILIAMTCIDVATRGMRF